MSNVGKSDYHNVERNCRVFHVVQHAKGDVPYFENEEVCKIRERAIEEACLKYKVRVLHTVTMPDHTHDIVIVSDVDTMFRFYQSVNTSVSRAVRRLYGEEVANKNSQVFSSRPAYVPIASLLQYYSTVKYLYDNPKVDASVGKGGFEYPHSSFRYYRNGTCPPYAADVPQEVFHKEDCSAFYEVLDGGAGHGFQAGPFKAFHRREDWTT